MDPRIEVVIVSERHEQVALLIKQVRSSLPHVHFKVAQTREELFKAVQEVETHLILADSSQSSFSALEVLRMQKASASPIPVLVVSGRVDPEYVVEAFRAGAVDFCFDKDLPELHILIKRVVNPGPDRHEKNRNSPNNIVSENFDEAFRESEEKFRSFFQNSVDGVIISSPDGKIFSANPSACEMLNRSEEEICRMGRNGIADVTDSRLTMAIAEREKKGKAKAEITLFKNDGTKVPVELSSSIYTNSKGEPLTIVIFRDITERRKIEDTLKASQENYKLLFEKNPIPSWIYELDTLQILEVNNAAILHYGYSREEFLKLNLRDLRPESQIGALEQHINKKVRASGVENHGKFIHHKKDGSLITVEIFGYQFEYYRKNCRLVVCNDVTEKENALAELKAEKARLQAAHEIANLGFWQLEVEEDRLYISDQMYGLWGRDKDSFEQTYHFFLSTIHPEDLKKFEKAQDESIIKTKVHDIKYRILLPNEEIKWIQEKGKVIKKAGNKAVVVERTVRDITKEVERERALKEAKSKFELVSRATSDAVWDWNLVTNELIWGESFFNLFGHKADTFVSRIETWNDLIHPDDLEKTSLGIDEVLQSDRNVWESEYRLRKGNGEYAYVEDRGFVTRTPEGTPHRMVGAIKDVTEKRELQELLNKANELSRIGSYEVDFTKNTLYWSPMTKEIHEVDPHYVPSLEEILTFCKSEADTKKVNDSVQLAVAEKTPFDIEICLITGKGNERWVRIIGEPQFERENCVRLSGSVQDIDSRKKAELALLEAYSEKETILESIGDAFVALNFNWTVTYWNKKAEELLLCPRETVIGKNVWEVFPDATDIFLPHYQKAMEERSNQQFEAWFERTQMWYEVTAYPSVSGLSIFFKDVTERVRLNRNLKKYTRDLVMANKGLEQFSYIVSHNLRAPVANIIGLANILEQEESAEVRDQCFQQVFHNVNRLDNIVRDLNDILQTKVETQLKKEKIDLEAIIHSIRESIENLIEQENVHFHIDFDDCRNIYSIYSYLYSIFYNLIFNSIKYRKTDVPPIIEITSQRRRGHVIITISDNGLGLDLGAKREQIFGLYKRFHHHVEGKGMGLYMVKTQVDLLGGRISVSSKVGEGTSFRLILKEESLPTDPKGEGFRYTYSEKLFK